MEMTTPTPETLREMALTILKGRRNTPKLLALANAWEAQVKKAEERAFTHQVIDATLELRDENKSLRTRLAEAETTAKNYLASHTKALADDDPTGTCAANHRGYIECAKAVLAALAHGKEKAMTPPTPDDLRMSADDADTRAAEVVMSSAYVRAAADAWQLAEDALAFMLGTTHGQLYDKLKAAEKRLAEAECPDKLTAGALAKLIADNKVPSPWRDTGTKLKAFGKWLAALAHDKEKP